MYNYAKCSSYDGQKIGWMKMRDKRKTEITIFIVIGIVIVATVASTLILRNKEKNSSKETLIEEVNDSDDIVTRYEWIKELCEEFGLEENDSCSAFFCDVDNTSEYYTYVQSAAYWGIVDGDNFDGDQAVTGKYAALTALKAIGEYKIKIYMAADDFLSDKEYLRFAIDNELISNVQKMKKLSPEECAAVLENAKTMSDIKLWKDDYAQINWYDGVNVYDSADALQFENGEYLVLVSGDKEYKEGDIIVFPNEKGAKVIRKIDSLNTDGTYELSEATIEETCKSAVISDSCEITFDDMVEFDNYDRNLGGGHTEETRYFENTGFTLLPMSEFEGTSKGYKIEVSINPDEETMEVTIRNNNTNGEKTIKLPIPDDLKDAETSNEVFQVSAEVDKFCVRGQIDYNLLNIRYLDINAEVHSTMEGTVELFDNDVKIPLGNALAVFQSGVFEVEVKVYLVLEASGKIGFEIEVPAMYELTYEKGKGFRKTHNVHPVEPQMVLEAEADIALRTELIPGLFLTDIIDIDLEVGAYAEGNMKTRPTDNPAVCFDVEVAAPTLTLGVGLDDSNDFMLLKNDLLGVEYKWEILNKDNAPIKKGNHLELGKTTNYEFQKVAQCTYKSEEVKDDDIYRKLQEYLIENNYPFRDTFVLEMDKDYSEYETSAPWKDCGEYYEVEGYIYLNPFVPAGNRHSKDDGADELANSTINIVGSELKTGDVEILNYNKEVLDGLEIIEGQGKAIIVNEIDGDNGNGNVYFLYGPSDDMIKPRYYERYHNLEWVAEEMPDQYYYELCETYYDDYDGNMSDITAAWFTHWLEIPTISDKKVTLKIKKDAVMAITLGAENPEDIFMATVQDFYENKITYPNWEFYQWYAPNEYGWCPMSRARITFDMNGYVKEVVPMVLSD